MACLATTAKAREFTYVTKANGDKIQQAGEKIIETALYATFSANGLDKSSSRFPVIRTAAKRGIGGFLRVSLKAGASAAGYLLMEKVANFTDADVEKLAEPLRPLVGASQGLQV